MKIGYMRVSTVMQDHALQEQALNKAGVLSADIYQDTISGTKTSRDGMEACLSRLQKGDTLVVYKLDRLGRTVRMLKDVVDGLADRGVSIQSVCEEINTGTPAGKLFFHMIAVFAEFERDVIAERTKAGIAAKRVGGRAWGRPRAVEVDDNEIRALLEEMPPAWVAHETGVSLSTVRRIKRAA